VIRFVILDNDQPDAVWLETVTVQISFDGLSCHYSSEAKSFTPSEIERFRARAGTMKHPETGEPFLVAPVFMNDRVKENPDMATKHIRAYFGHPLQFVTAQDIKRLTAL
jgi:hypothetical protein